MEIARSLTVCRQRVCRNRFAGMIGLAVLWLLGGGPAHAADPVPAADGLAPPLSTIGEFLAGARAWGESRRVRLTGTVTHALPDRTFFMQDGDAGVYVFTKPADPVVVGTRVEVSGFPSLGGLNPTLQRCTVTALGPGAVIPVWETDFTRALNVTTDMRLVRLQGRLRPDVPRGRNNWMISTGGTNGFIVNLDSVADLSPLAHLEPGSLLELTGVCGLRTAADRSLSHFVLFVRTAADVRVLAGPPWWNGPRLWTATTVAVGGLAAALLWVSTLRRQVRQKTLALRSQLEQTAILERSYRRLFEANPHPMWVYDVKSLRFLAVNAAAVRHYGHSLAEFLGMTLRDIRPPEDVPALVRAATELKPGLDVTGLWRHRKKNGELIEVEITAHALEFHGQPAGIVLAHDVTAQRRAEAELRRSENRFATIFRTCPDGILIVRAADERIIDLNPAYERLAGFTAGEACGKTTAELGLWADPSRRAPTIRRLKEAGSLTNVELQLRRRDQSRLTVLVSAEVVEFGGETCLLSQTRDITERRRAEQERQDFELKLLQAQKLESLGVLAGGIAHDFNNLLTAVMGNLSLAVLDLHPANPARQALFDAEQATQRAADLARQMLAYSGKGRFVIQRVHLADMVREMTPMLQVSVSKQAGLRFDFADPIPAVEVDVTQLRQVILNLVLNASDALGERSGVIAVSVGVLDCDPAYLATTWLGDAIAAGRYSFIEVADTGCGITPEDLPKIFDPFYTTKFTGRGLGLAAVLGIVRGHHGALKVTSAVNRGTTFTVLFPAAPATAESAGPANAPAADWRGRGLVLLVDDEASIRGIAQRLLERLGFQVATAADGRAAVELVREQGDQLTCILLDLTMPHMDGEETFREIRKLRTDIPVVLTSGYSEQDVAERFAGQDLAGFVPKPFSLPSLQAALRKAVAKPAAGDFEL